MIRTDLTEAVTTWVNATRAELKTNGFAQIDLDSLINDRPALAVQTALSCLELAIRQVRETDPDVDGMVTVPLSASDSLTRDSPTLGELLELSWQYGPGAQVPGLYLLARSHWSGYEAVEEYRVHLAPTREVPDGYAAYYRTWRSTTAAEQGWEYDRAIYIRTVGETAEPP